MIKDPLLQSLVQLNCIPVLIIVFLFFFLVINYRYEKELSIKFTPSVALLLALIVVDNFDYYAYDSMMSRGVFQIFRRFIAMLGYDLRILLMASLIAIAVYRINGSKKSMVRTYLPALINVPILSLCLFTDLFFYYNDDGSIGRGIFAYEPHILSAVYMMFLFALGFMCRKRGRFTEMGILILCGCMTVLGFLAEFLFSLRGILIGVVALDITFYYLYLHIEHFRFDALTGIFNREAFLADVDKFGRTGISHIMSIDLNNLKQLNDNYGHNEGDKALKAVAKALESSCSSRCYVYRVGGDEFAAICQRKTTEEIEKMVGEMYRRVEEAGYSCAIGYSEWDDSKTFTEVYKDADDKMYVKKRAMKEIAADTMRVR